MDFLGGHPGDDEKGLALFSKLDRTKMTEDFLVVANWLRERPDSTGKLGGVGYCFGGGVVNQLAVRMGSDLTAGVPFYGAQPNTADALKIGTNQCAIRRPRGSQWPGRASPGAAA